MWQAAAALRVKTVLSKAAWWPWTLTLWPWERCPSNVWLSLSVLDLGPMYATEVRRQTNVRQKNRLMPPPIMGGGIIICRENYSVLRQFISSAYVHCAGNESKHAVSRYRVPCPNVSILLMWAPPAHSNRVQRAALIKYSLSSVTPAER